MAVLCDQSPIDIALDEELIGVHEEEERRKLLETIRPKYIILKPSLIGGFMSAEIWIRLAMVNSVGYWVTSALESNIGLNAIAQWAYDIDVASPHGLGTGQLYSNNFEGPLHIKNGSLHFNPDIPVYQNFHLF